MKAATSSRFLVSSAILSVACAFAASAQDRSYGPSNWQEQPNFSGSWIGSAPEHALVIEHDGANLLIVEVRESQEARFAYRLNGEESRNMTEHETLVSQAKWIGSALLVTTVATLANGDVRELLDIYSLQSDDALVVTRVDNPTSGPHHIMLTNTEIFYRGG